jgi:DNA-binding winged helix-turn-helix (wHTH) protein
MGQVSYFINDQFKISTDTNEIILNVNQSGESIIKVEHRVMEVLKILIEANGEMVSREYLLDKVWDNYDGGVEGLNQAVSKLRKIFLDDAKNAKVIETISKKGYRIIAKIELENDKGFVKVKSNIRTKKVPGIILLLEYLKKPKHLLVFVILSVIGCTLLYLIYKIIYAIVWS